MDKAGPLQHDANPEAMFDGLNFVQSRHGNKGYARDPESGNYLGEEFGDVHMGYAWHYRCIELPRLVQVIHIMHPLCGDWLEWHVDGVKCIDAGEAIAQLNRPAELTLPEAYALYRMSFPCERSDAINAIAGATNPRPNFIYDRWSLASRLIDALRDKDIIYFDEEGILQCRQR